MLADMKVLAGGYCTHLERMVMQGGRFAKVSFPSMFFHIHHPSQGHILFDTGYSERFFQETRCFPERLYAALTPVSIKSEQTATKQLESMNITSQEIGYIFISHFHADHIAGLKDFPNAKFILSKAAWHHLDGVGRIRGLFKGFLRGLLPRDFVERSMYYEDFGKPKALSSILSVDFDGWDLFADNLLFAVDLPGHAAGHSGLFVQTSSGPKFLVADACWMSRSYRELRSPMLPSFLIMDSRKQYLNSLAQLNQIHETSPNLEIIPSHCGEIYRTHVCSNKADIFRLNGQNASLTQDPS